MIAAACENIAQEGKVRFELITTKNSRLSALFSEQDLQSDGSERASSRFARAVLAASRHTTDAHLVLVADGFELDAVTREIVVRFHRDMRRIRCSIAEIVWPLCSAFAC